MKAERLKEIPLTDAELAEIGDADLERYTAEQNRPLNAAELKRLDCIAEHLTSRDMEDAEIVWRAMRTIERLSSQAPLQVSGDAALRIRAEAIVASPYWGGCEKNIAEHILTGKYDSLHASVHKAALATPRGEGSQTK